MQQTTLEPVGVAPARSGSAFGLFRRIGLYVFMVLWVVVGLGYADIYPERATPFWQITAGLFALIAVAHVLWRGGQGRMVLALKQVVHWGAFFAVMEMLHLRVVVDLVTGDPLGIVMMLLVALATFLDGVYVDWRFCVVGAALAAGAVLIAILDDAALALAGLGLLAILILYAFHRLTAAARRPAAEV